MNGLMIAITAMLSVLTALGVSAVAQLGVIISQLADLKAYVRTIISGDIDLGNGWFYSPKKITQAQADELAAKLKGTQCSS